MKLYSYLGQEPKTLPTRIRLENGETRTSLNELTDLELEEFGFHYVIVPEYSEESQEIKWNSSTKEYEVFDLPEDAILFKKKLSVDLKEFKNFLLNNFQEKIKSCSDNHLCSCFDDLISCLDLRSISEIKNNLIILYLLHDFSEEEKQQIFNEFQRLEINLLFEHPTEEEISKYSYDRNFKKLVFPEQYSSWTLVNGDWTCPVTDPIIMDEFNPPGILTWDESTLSWIYE